LENQPSIRLVRIDNTIPEEPDGTFLVQWLDLPGWKKELTIHVLPCLLLLLHW
jgi:hypothetical protein